jgi:hypothetical protein
VQDKKSSRGSYFGTMLSVELKMALLNTGCKLCVMTRRLRIPRPASSFLHSSESYLTVVVQHCEIPIKKS